MKSFFQRIHDSQVSASKSVSKDLYKTPITKPEPERPRQRTDAGNVEVVDNGSSSRRYGEKRSSGRTRAPELSSAPGPTPTYNYATIPSGGKSHTNNHYPAWNALAQSLPDRSQTKSSSQPRPFPEGHTLPAHPPEKAQATREGTKSARHGRSQSEQVSRPHETWHPPVQYATPSTRAKESEKDKYRPHEKSRQVYPDKYRDMENVRERERGGEREKDREQGGERERARDREKERERDGKGRERERERDEKGREREQEREKENGRKVRERDRERDRDGDKEKDREREKERKRELDRGWDRDKDRDVERDREKERRKERVRDSDTEKDRERERRREREKETVRDSDTERKKDRDRDRERDRDAGGGRDTRNLLTATDSTNGTSREKYRDRTMERTDKTLDRDTHRESDRESPPNRPEHRQIFKRSTRELQDPREEGDSSDSSRRKPIPVLPTHRRHRTEESTLSTQLGGRPHYEPSPLAGSSFMPPISVTLQPTGASSSSENREGNVPTPTPLAMPVYLPPREDKQYRPRHDRSQTIDLPHGRVSGSETEGAKDKERRHRSGTVTNTSRGQDVAVSNIELRSTNTHPKPPTRHLEKPPEPPPAPTEKLKESKGISSRWPFSRSKEEPQNLSDPTTHAPLLAEKTKRGSIAAHFVGLRAGQGPSDRPTHEPIHKPSAPVATSIRPEHQDRSHSREPLQRHPASHRQLWEEQRHSEVKQSAYVAPRTSNVASTAPLQSEPQVVRPVAEVLRFTLSNTNQHRRSGAQATSGTIPLLPGKIPESQDSGSALTQTEVPLETQARPHTLTSRNIHPTETGYRSLEASTKQANLNIPRNGTSRSERERSTDPLLSKPDPPTGASQIQPTIPVYELQPPSYDTQDPPPTQRPKFSINDRALSTQHIEIEVPSMRLKDTQVDKAKAYHPTPAPPMATRLSHDRTMSQATAPVVAPVGEIARSMAEGRPQTSISVPHLVAGSEARSVPHSIPFQTNSGPSIPRPAPDERPPPVYGSTPIVPTLNVQTEVPSIATTNVGVGLSTQRPSTAMGSRPEVELPPSSRGYPVAPQISQRPSYDRRKTPFNATSTSAAQPLPARQDRDDRHMMPPSAPQVEQRQTASYRHKEIHNTDSATPPERIGASQSSQLRELLSDKRSSPTIYTPKDYVDPNLSRYTYSKAPETVPSTPFIRSKAPETRSVEPPHPQDPAQLSTGRLVEKTSETQIGQVAQGTSGSRPDYQSQTASRPIDVQLTAHRKHDNHPPAPAAQIHQSAVHASRPEVINVQPPQNHHGALLDSRTVEDRSQPSSELPAHHYPQHITQSTSLQAPQEVAPRVTRSTSKNASKLDDSLLRRPVPAIDPSREREDERKPAPPRTYSIYPAMPESTRPMIHHPKLAELLSPPPSVSKIFGTLSMEDPSKGPLSSDSVVPPIHDVAAVVTSDSSAATRARLSTDQSQPRITNVKAPSPSTKSLRTPPSPPKPYPPTPSSLPRANSASTHQAQTPYTLAEAGETTSRSHAATTTPQRSPSRAYNSPTKEPLHVSPVITPRNTPSPRTPGHRTSSHNFQPPTNPRVYDPPTLLRTNQSSSAYPSSSLYRTHSNTPYPGVSLTASTPNVINSRPLEPNARLDTLPVPPQIQVMATPFAPDGHEGLKIPTQSSSTSRSKSGPYESQRAQRADASRARETNGAFNIGLTAPHLESNLSRSMPPAPALHAGPSYQPSAHYSSLPSSTVPPPSAPPIGYATSRSDANPSAPIAPTPILHSRTLSAPQALSRVADTLLRMPSESEQSFLKTPSSLAPSMLKPTTSRTSIPDSSQHEPHKKGSILDMFKSRPAQEPAPQPYEVWRPPSSTKTPDLPALRPKAESPTNADPTGVSSLSSRVKPPPPILVAPQIRTPSERKSPNHHGRVFTPFRYLASKRNRTMSALSVEAQDGTAPSTIVGSPTASTHSQAPIQPPPLRDPQVATEEWRDREAAEARVHAGGRIRRKRPGVVFDVAEDVQEEKRSRPRASRRTHGGGQSRSS